MAGTITDPSAEQSPPVRRGRPPIGANRAAVLTATRELLAAEGYQRMTLEAVATRAGLYRRYIHRTWRSKAELVRDALFDDVAAFRAPDTGSIESDVRELVAQHVDLITRPEFLRGLPGLQGEFGTDPELWRETLDRHVGPPAAGFDAVLSRAMSRGEIEDHVAPMVVLGTVSGALQHVAHLGLLGRDELIEHGVRLVLDAMVR